MIVNYISWASAKITYDKPIPPKLNSKKWRKEEELRDVYVFFDSKDNTLTVRDVVTGDGMTNNHYLLARAKVKSLSPWKAEFEAHWWNEKGEMTRCDVVCTFEDRK